MADNPDPPIPAHPARVIREILGLSQWEMGKLLDVSRDAVEKVENRRMPMPRDLAYRYRVATGCDLRLGDPKTAKEGPIEVVAACDGEPYTRAFFDDYQRLMGSEEHLAYLTEQMKDRLGKLLNRAAEMDKGKVKGVVGDFCEFLSETIRRRELGVDLMDLFSNPERDMTREK
jgi:hypothetical protein